MYWEGIHKVIAERECTAFPACAKGSPMCLDGKNYYISSIGWSAATNPLPENPSDDHRICLHVQLDPV
jgi:hypothetical protein